MNAVPRKPPPQRTTVERRHDHVEHSRAPGSRYERVEYGVRWQDGSVEFRASRRDALQRLAEATVWDGVLVTRTLVVGEWVTA